MLLYVCGSALRIASHRSNMTTRVLALLLAITLAAYAQGAPAPFSYAKPELKRDNVVGTWQVSWACTNTVIIFYRNGSYECPEWCGSRYIGLWCVKDNVLTIRERQEDANFDYCYNFSMNPRTMTSDLKTLKLVRRLRR